MCMYVRTTYSKSLFFFFNDTATTEIYTLSLHDALPISPPARFCLNGARLCRSDQPQRVRTPGAPCCVLNPSNPNALRLVARSEEHTSELQSLAYLVCRLLLEKKKKTSIIYENCICTGHR